MREDIRKIQEMMEAAEYVTDAPVATSVHLAMRLRKPLQRGKYLVRIRAVDSSRNVEKPSSTRLTIR